jgi:hypothetical protein
MLRFSVVGDVSASSAGAGNESITAVSDEVEAKILSLDLDLDGDKLKPTAVAGITCYKLASERAALYAELAPGLTEENAVAVTCACNGYTVETIVKSDTMEHCKFTDPVMWSEVTFDPAHVPV